MYIKKLFSENRPLYEVSPEIVEKILELVAKTREQVPSWGEINMTEEFSLRAKDRNDLPTITIIKPLRESSEYCYVDLPSLFMPTRIHLPEELQLFLRLELYEAVEQT